MQNASRGLNDPSFHLIFTRGLVYTTPQYYYVLRNYIQEYQTIQLGE